MTARRFLKLNIGPQRPVNRVESYPNEARYVDDIRGQMRDITSNLIKVFDGIKAASPDILLDALEPTFELSQYYCPVDTGALKGSGYLEVTEFRSNPRVEMGYAKNNDPPYAVVVHENLEWRHKWPTRAKFLQAAVDEDMEDIKARVQQAYQDLVND